MSWLSHARVLTAVRCGQPKVLYLLADLLSSLLHGWPVFVPQLSPHGNNPTAAVRIFLESLPTLCRNPCPQGRRSLPWEGIWALHLQAYSHCKQKALQPLICTEITIRNTCAALSRRPFIILSPQQSHKDCSKCNFCTASVSPSCTQVPRDNGTLLSPGHAAMDKMQGSWGWTSAAYPSAVQPILPSAMATEERNSTLRNAKPQPKPKANRAGSQQGRVSMRYVAACCVLLNSKHLATEEHSPKR